MHAHDPRKRVMHVSQFYKRIQNINMYQLQWAAKSTNHKGAIFKERNTCLNRREVADTLELIWEEHCVECAAPTCYQNCTLYVQRKDGDCARFVNGISPNTSFNGRYAFGADIEFRKWAKLEANLEVAHPSIFLRRFRWLTFLTPAFIRAGLERKACRLFFSGRVIYDDFIIECFSFDHDVTLHLEYFVVENHQRRSIFKQTFTLHHGRNFFNVPFQFFQMKELRGYIYLYPETMEGNKRIIFTWLDFVRYKQKRGKVKAENLSRHIKCVAWDIDNTLLQGTLLETEETLLPERNRIIIEQLDKRGILQTIISKNDQALVMSKLKELNIESFFLYPKINWERKSQNLAEIAKELNVSLSSFAFIDDSPFEREEVRQALPMVKVFSENDIDNIFSLEEFNTPITSMSAQRRVSYLTGHESKCSQTGYQRT